MHMETKSVIFRLAILRDVIWTSYVFLVGPIWKEVTRNTYTMLPNNYLPPKPQFQLNLTHQFYFLLVGLFGVK